MFSSQIQIILCEKYILGIQMGLYGWKHINNTHMHDDMHEIANVGSAMHISAEHNA